MQKSRQPIPLAFSCANELVYEHKWMQMDMIIWTIGWTGFPVYWIMDWSLNFTDKLQKAQTPHLPKVIVIIQKVDFFSSVSLMIVSVERWVHGVASWRGNVVKLQSHSCRWVCLSSSSTEWMLLQLINQSYFYPRQLETWCQQDFRNTLLPDFVKIMKHVWKWIWCTAGKENCSTN